MAELIPAVGWLRRYDRAWLRADLVAGVAAGAVVVPQAMAYATIADLPVQVGLYTCMTPMVVYALLGGSRCLSMSTTSTVAVLTASTMVAAGVAAGADDPAGDLATLTLLVGVIMLAARLLRLGGVIDNISQATLTGIKAGVGLNVAAGQLPKILGIAGEPDTDSFFGQLRVVFEQLGDVSVATVALSVCTIALLLALARLAPQVPAPLVVVALGILLVAGWSIDAHGVAVIPSVPSGLPTPVAPSTDRLELLVPGAFAIAIMCFLETASVGRSVRRRDEPPIDNDEELVANGIACIAGAVLRSMPPAGGFSQTAINRSAGARTQVSGLVTALLAVACVLFLGGVLSDIPEATLGCMVMVAVLGLIDPADFVRFWRLGRIEFWVAVATTGAGLVVGLLGAVLVGVLLTLVLVIRELDGLGVVELEPTPDGSDIRVAGEHTEAVDGLLMLRFEGPLYTANVHSAVRKVSAFVDDARPGTLVLDASAVAILPVTVLDEMYALEDELAGIGVELWFAALPPRTLATARLGERWNDVERAGRFFPSSLAAYDAYRSGSTRGGETGGS